MNKTYVLVPQYQLVLRDGDGPSMYKAVPSVPQEKVEREEVLEIYFNDIYHLFLNKLVKITHESILRSDDADKLQAMLKEIIKVKKLLEKTEDRQA